MIDLSKPIAERAQVSELSYEEFSDPRVFQRLEIDLSSPEYLNKIGTAIDFSSALSELLKKYSNLEKEKPDLFQKYQNLADLLKIFALPACSKEELKEIFGSKILFALKNNINITERVNRLYQINYFFPDAIAEIRELLLKALIDNKEILGQKKIRIKEREAEPYLGAFIFDYRLTYDNPKQKVNPVNQSDYITNSLNTKQLNDEEKLLLLKVIRLYDYILIPSLNREAFPQNYDFSQEKRIKTEEQLTVPKRKKIRMSPRIDLVDIENADIEVTEDGIRIKFSETEELPVKSIRKPETGDLKEKLIKAVKKYDFLLKNIKENEGLVLKEIESNPDKIKEGLILAVNEKNPEKTAAALFILARLRKIDRLMSEMPVKKIFMEEIIPLLSRQIGSISEPELIDKFKQNPNNPVYVKIFLKYILSKAFEGREEEGAFVATQLENILSILENTEYLGLAFYNLKTEKYEWAEVKISESGDLIME